MIVYHIASLFAVWQIEDQDPLIEVGLVLGCTCLRNRGENLQSDRCHHPRLQLRLCSPEINRKIAWENTQHSATPPPISPQNDVWETTAEIPYWWRVNTQIWLVLLIGRAVWGICFNTLPRSGYWRVISIKFLRSFLRRDFARKPGGG